jgi:hypothetical protein
VGVGATAAVVKTGILRTRSTLLLLLVVVVVMVREEQEKERQGEEEEEEEEEKLREALPAAWSHRSPSHVLSCFVITRHPIIGFEICEAAGTEEP